MGLFFPTLTIKESKSLSLDLLTFNDLEMLRNKKGGNVSTASSTKQQTAMTANVNNKRVLILTYNVEFDRLVILTIQS